MDHLNEVLVTICQDEGTDLTENLGNDNDAFSPNESEVSYTSTPSIQSSCDSEASSTGTTSSHSTYIPAIEDLHNPCYQEGPIPSSFLSENHEHNQGRNTCTDEIIESNIPPPEYTEYDSNRPCHECKCCHSPCWNQRCLVKFGITCVATIVISFVLAIAVKVVIFAPYSFHSSPSDQIEIHTFPSTYFCESIQIESTSMFSTFFLVFPPTVDQKDQSHYQDKITFGIAPGDYSYWGFSMLEGSDINLEVCTHANADVLIFKGQGDFNTFQSGCLGNECPYLLHQVAYGQSCNGSSNRTIITIADTEQDYYYIVISARSSQRTVPGTISISLSRSVYSAASIGDSACVSDSSCLMTGTEATYGILFVAPADSGYNAYNKVKCYADYRTYLFIFVVIPVMIAVVFCVSIVLKAKQVGKPLYFLQHTFNTFVGGKLLGPTFLGSPTLRTVGVGVTFSLLLWKFCWTYRFWLPNSKNCFSSLWLASQNL